MPARANAAIALRCWASRRPGRSSASVEIRSARLAPANPVVMLASSSKSARRTSTPRAANPASWAGVRVVAMIGPALRSRRSSRTRRPSWPEAPVTRSGVEGMATPWGSGALATMSQLRHVWCEMAPIDLNLLRVFATVYQAGSFTAAAKKLGVPRSTVSRAIAALEDRVGDELIHRTTRTMSMSAEGKLLFDRIAPSLTGLEAALGDLPARADAELTG